MKRKKKDGKTRRYKKQKKKGASATKTRLFNNRNKMNQTEFLKNYANKNHAVLTPK